MGIKLIRLNLTILKQYRNSVLEKFFLRKKDAVQNVYKGHDWVQKTMYVTRDNTKKNELD